MPMPAPTVRGASPRRTSSLSSWATWPTTCSSISDHEAVPLLHLGVLAGRVLGPVLRPGFRRAPAPRGPGLDLGRGPLPRGHPGLGPDPDPPLLAETQCAGTGAQDLR